MRGHLDWAHRRIPIVLGVCTLASVAVLLAWDLVPALFPPGAHDVLGALPLVLIALAYLAYQTVRRPGRQELLKAVLLALAFLLWGANQLWPSLPQATLYNDLAIALFVLDVFLVMVGWPSTSPDEDFAETYPGDEEPAD